jgi:hypothetical protein
MRWKNNRNLNLMEEKQKEIKNMQLYTFLFEYKKGTYIYQERGQGIEEAIKLWAENLPIEKISGTDISFKEALLCEVEDILQNNGITPVNSVMNVWCCSFLFNDDAVGILTVVSTT